MIDTSTTEEPSSPAVAVSTEPAAAFHPLDKRVIWVWRISSAIGFGILLLALLIGAVVATFAVPDAAVLVWPAWIALAALCSWLIYWYPGRIYDGWGYRVDARALEIRHGRAFQVTKLLPLSRLQHVDLHRGPLERAFGLSSLILHTAGTREATLKIPGLAADEAVRLRDHLVAVGGDDAV